MFITNSTLSIGIHNTNTCGGIPRSNSTHNFCTTPTARTYEATTDTTALKADAHGKIKAAGLLTAILPAAFPQYK